MAQNEVKTVFTVDSTQAKAGAEEATRAVDKSAKTQEDSVNRLGKTASFVQAAISKILIPATIAASVVRIAQSWIEVQKQVRAARDEVESTQRSMLDLSRQDVFGVRKGDELEEAQKKVTEQIRKQAEAQSEINKKRQEELSLMSEKDKAVFKAGTGRSTDEEIARLEKERDQIFADSARRQAEARDRLARDYEVVVKQRAEKADAEARARAQETVDETARINAGLIDDAEERERALQRIEQEATQRRLDLAKTAEERDAIFALGEAKFREYQQRMNAIAEEGNKTREENTMRSIRAQVDAALELRDAFQSAYQAQQQFSQSLTSGLAADIRAIKQLLELRGGWKK
jgi:hypothetical protein